MSLKNLSDPLAEQKKAFQAETGSPLGYDVRDQKMPSISLTVGSQQNSKVAPFKAVDTSFRNPSDLSDSMGPDNMRSKFVNLGMDTPPGSFGH